MAGRQLLDVDKTQEETPETLSKSASKIYDKVDTLNVQKLFEEVSPNDTIRQRNPQPRSEPAKNSKELRPVLDQELFDKKYGYRRVDLTLGRRVYWHFLQLGKWNGKEWWRHLLKLIPILIWLPKYQWMDWIVADVVGGIVCAIMSVPQGLAYGYMVGVPPNYGLITGIFGPLVYAILGTSRHTSPGSFAIVSLMVGSTVQKYSTPRTNTTNFTDPAMEEEAIKIATTMTLMVGIFQVIFAILNMGLLAVWLSDQLVQGLTSGAAVHVLTSQIKSMTGIPSLPPTNDPFSLPKFYICLFTQITKTNMTTLTIALISMSLLLFSCYIIDPLLQRHIRIKFPMELILVVYSVLLVSLSKGTRYDIDTKVVGHVRSGLVMPTMPDHPKWADMIGDAITTAIISFVIHISLAKMIAKRLNYEIDPNHEWFALGFMHCFSSFFGCFAGGSSLGRTMTQVKFGTKSQLSTIICCSMLVGCVYGAASVIYHLPKAVLAAIVVVAMKDLYIQLFRSFRIFRSSYIDFLIYLVTLLSVIFINVMYGLMIGVCFALLSVVFRTQWADSTCMGRIPGTADYKGLGHYRSAEEVPGVKVFRFDAPLYFANAETFICRMYTACGVNPIQVKASMQEKEQEERQKLKKDMGASTEEAESLVKGQEMEIQMKKQPSQERIKGQLSQLTHIIIDCSSVTYVDLMGKDALAQCYLDYKAIDITVLFAHCKVSVRQTFETSGFYSIVPKNRMFVSIEDAVRFAMRTKMSPTDSCISRTSCKTVQHWDNKKAPGGGAPVAHSPAQKTIQKRKLGLEKTQSLVDINTSATAQASMDIWVEKPQPLFEQKSQDSMDKTQ